MEDKNPLPGQLSEDMLGLLEKLPVTAGHTWCEPKPKTSRPMSVNVEPPTSPAVLGLVLDTGKPWHQTAVQRSRIRARTSPLSGFVPPSATTEGARPTKTPVRLPSLAAAKDPHRQVPVVPLSFSEPSLFAPSEISMFEGFYTGHRPGLLRKRPPPLVHSSSPATRTTFDPSGKRNTPMSRHHLHRRRSCPVYTHFSQPVRPSSMPAPVKPLRHSGIQTLQAVQGDLLPPVRNRYGHSPPHRETLSVVGKQCRLSSGHHHHQAPPPSSATPLPRAQLHVFLPSEREEEELDSESVDEGFKDELDSKITSLRLQKGHIRSLHMASALTKRTQVL